jgi:hypothetical protein
MATPMRSITRDFILIEVHAFTHPLLAGVPQAEEVPTHGTVVQKGPDVSDDIVINAEVMFPRWAMIDIGGGLGLVAEEAVDLTAPSLNNVSYKH